MSSRSAGEPPWPPPQQRREERPAGVRRRSLLAGGAAVMVTGGLVACGDGRPARGAGTAATAGTPLIPAGDVPVGGGVILPEHQMVVTQPTAGEFKGFSFVCTHAGCPVNQVKDGEIRCPCHGSHFSIATGAPGPGSPATRPLATMPVSLQDGQVVAG